MFFFHKTEVQTVILMCLMGQNLNWSKSYDTKCTLRPRKILAKSEFDHQNLHLINGHFTTNSGHFCANWMKIFHKMEVQTVTLRCWTSLNHDWYNSYDTKCKWNPKMQKTQETEKTLQVFFLQNWKKLEREIFAFWVITFEPIKI